MNIICVLLKIEGIKKILIYGDGLIPIITDLIYEDGIPKASSKMKLTINQFIEFCKGRVGYVGNHKLTFIDMQKDDDTDNTIEPIIDGSFYIDGKKPNNMEDISPILMFENIEKELKKIEEELIGDDERKNKIIKLTNEYNMLLDKKIKSLEQILSNYKGEIK